MMPRPNCVRCKSTRTRRLPLNPDYTRAHPGCNQWECRILHCRARFPYPQYAQQQVEGPVHRRSRSRSLSHRNRSRSLHRRSRSRSPPPPRNRSRSRYRSRSRSRSHRSASRSRELRARSRAPVRVSHSPSPPPTHNSSEQQRSEETQGDSNHEFVVAIATPYIMLTRECGICFNHKPVAELSTVQGCRHYYCTVCLSRTLETKPKCPMCRRPATHRVTYFKQVTALTNAAVDVVPNPDDGLEDHWRFRQILTARRTDLHHIEYNIHWDDNSDTWESSDLIDDSEDLLIFWRTFFNHHRERIPDHTQVQEWITQAEEFADREIVQHIADVLVDFA